MAGMRRCRTNLSVCRRSTWIGLRRWPWAARPAIAFDYGEWEAIGVKPEVPPIMFDEFLKSGHLALETPLAA